MSISGNTCHLLQGVRDSTESNLATFMLRTGGMLALALNLNQWNTAIPVVPDINKNLLTLGKETRDGFEKLGTKMHEGFEKLGTEIHEGAL